MEYGPDALGICDVLANVLCASFIIMLVAEAPQMSQSHF